MFKFFRSYGWLLLILLVGALMRFWNFSMFSLTNDELSALLRTGYDSFSELIGQGVIATDPHPAGVQVFLNYWTGWFGKEAFVVRLPFVLLSILTVWVSYLIAERWFGRNSALLLAAVMAVLEFPILFGQIARPYSVGLFFSMSMVYCWTRMLFEEKHRTLMAAGYAVFAALCCYTHYFCGLFAAIVGLTGFFFLRKSNIKAYIVSNVVVLLLFLPHFNITLHHLQIGGLSGWLPKPDPDFIFSHILFLFNDSVFLLVFCLLVVIVLAWVFRQDLRHSVFRYVALAWFLFPLLVGYWYSVNYHTVLMDRVLLFTFPYLLIFLFSFVQPLRPAYWLPAGILLLLGGGIYSTVVEKRFYHTPHFEDFRLMAEKIREWNEKYGADNITRTVNVNSPFYLEYYFNRMDYQTDFERHVTMRGEDVAEFRQLIRGSNTPYFLAGWACIYNPYELPEMIKRKYPVEVEKVKVFNTEVILYGMDSGNSMRKRVLYHPLDFEKERPEWSLQQEHRDSAVSYTGNWSYHLQKDEEYGPTLKIEAKPLLEAGVNVISVSAHFMSSQKPGALLVMSIDRGEENLAWFSTVAASFYTEPHVWQEVFMAEKLPEGIRPTDRIVIYFWNKDKDEMRIDDMEVTSYEDSHYHYYD